MDTKDRLSKTILIVAGEVSGDLWGCLLARALRSLDRDIELFGIGLNRMREAGVSLLTPPDKMIRLSVAGGFGNFGTLPKLIQLRRRILEEVSRRKPDAAVLIDYPGFNLNLAKKLSRFSIPLFYYAPPQVWLWGRWRLKSLKRYFERLLVFFPFEEEFYKKEGLEAEWIGHPLLNWLDAQQGKSLNLANWGFERSQELIGLFPGSRWDPIRRNLPPMLEAARLLHQENPDRRFLIPVPPPLSTEAVMKRVADHDSYVTVVSSEVAPLLPLLKCALVVTGTAALEAAFGGVPLVLSGRFHPLAYRIATRLLGIRPLGIPNRLAGGNLVPELWQDEATGPRLAQAVGDLLRDSSKYQEAVDGLKKIKEPFVPKGDASLNAAHRIYSKIR